MRYYAIVISLFILSIEIAYAQESAAVCTRALVSSEEAFDQGRLLFILDKGQNRTFHSCLEDDVFEPDEKVRANKLLTKTYMFTDNEREAERSLVNLLKSEREHILSPEDPAELRYLYSKFKTDPIFRIAFRASGNLTFPTILQGFSTSGAPVTDSRLGKNYATVLGTSFELMFERHLRKGWEVGLGAQLRTSVFQVTETVAGVDGGSNISYTINNQSRMYRVPIIGRYNFNYFKKTSDGTRVGIIPYLFAGTSVDVLSSAEYIDTNRQGGTAFTLPDGDNDLNANDQVSNLNASILAGAGVKLRFGRAKVNFITFEVRYDNSLFQYNNGNNRNANELVSFNIAYMEDDLTLNTVSVSVGWTHSIYLQRKRKEFR